MFIRDRFYEMVMIWENTAAVSSESMDGKMSLKRHCDRTLINFLLMMSLCILIKLALQTGTEH